MRGPGCVCPRSCSRLGMRVFVSANIDAHLSALSFSHAWVFGAGEEAAADERRRPRRPHRLPVTRARAPNTRGAAAQRNAVLLGADVAGPGAENAESRATLSKRNAAVAHCVCGGAGGGGGSIGQHGGG